MRSSWIPPDIRLVNTKRHPIQSELALLKRILKYVKDNPKMFKEIKSYKIFTQIFGGIYGAYVELVEFDSLADYERSSKRMQKDEAFAKMNKEFMSLIEPITLSSNLWTFVVQL